MHENRGSERCAAPLNVGHILADAKRTVALVAGAGKFCRGATHTAQNHGAIPGSSCSTTAEGASDDSTSAWWWNSHRFGEQTCR